jgi:hypothetical protein
MQVYSRNGWFATRHTVIRRGKKFVFFQPLTGQFYLDELVFVDDVIWSKLVPIAIHDGLTGAMVSDVPAGELIKLEVTVNPTYFMQDPPAEDSRPCPMCPTSGS